MAKKKKTKKIASENLEKTAQNFGQIFSEFGEAVSTIFKDSKLKSEMSKAADSLTSSAKILVKRFSDKEVKKQFRDVGKAAEKFGKNVSKTAKPVIKKAKKGIKKAMKKVSQKSAAGKKK